MVWCGLQQHTLETTSGPVPAATSETLLMSLFSLFLDTGRLKRTEKAAPLSRCPDNHLMLDRVAYKPGFPLNFKIILLPSVKYYKVGGFVEEEMHLK